MARCVVFAGIAGALTWLSGLASAQPVLITTPTTVGPADSTILGVPLATAQITVQGATLTMSGRHTVASLTLERNPGGQAAVLTHPNAATYDYSGGAGTDVVIGLWLTVTGSVSIQGASGGLPACGIDLTGRGHGPEVGPGAGTLSGGTAAGGAHGGGGGRSSVGALGGQSYGSFLEPSSFGSGGGRDADCCGYRTPGSGGGALRLIVQGTLSVDGFVSADGTAAAVGESGGGAGGGVWITAGQLVGAGRIAARGGNGWPSAGGGGGGGRVSATYTASTYAGTWDVSGGTGAQSGGAGTVFTKSTGASLGLLAIDNGSTPPGATTEFSGTVAIPASLRVGPGAIVGPRIGEAGLRLQVQGDATVENGGAVSASFRGFAAEAGDAPGQTSGGSAAGGGHGGAGGNSSVGALGGGTYGSVQFPVTMGSGGGRDTDCCGARTPGRGGGAVWLEVGGALVVQGEISAHGEAAPVGESGGGAGGSVYITAASLGGTGTIAADGGAGAPAAGGGGGGGGGRVAVYTQTFGFNGVARAVGGNGFVRGGAGTVYVRPGVASLATLTVDNGGVAGATTEFTGDVSLPASLVVGPGGIVGPPVGVSGLHLQFAGDVTVQVGGAISADARGFAPESGPAPGASSGGSAAGGGHGGAGGNSSVGALGGGTYGSVVAPVTLGSGGGRDTDCCGYRAPGRGGGAIRLTASGTVTIEGRASVEGGDAPVVESGGGAGGSLWITCGALAGAGVISADGGDGAPVTQGGGGGGGRIAVQYGSSSFTGVMTSTGGAGFVKGGAGTVYTVQTGQPLGTVTVANGGVFGATTEFAGAVTLAANLVVGPGAIVGPPVGDPSLVLNLGGGVTVQAGGRIGADARGHAAEAGPSPGANSGGAAGGGGHGGAGGASSFGASGGGCYGDVFSPTAMGSGGGRDTDCCGYRTPGRGGGVIKIVCAGPVSVFGEIRVNGGDATQESGGGAGGSLWIVAQSLAGDGVISADGGAGWPGQGGGGGGGRVAVHLAGSSTFAGSLRSVGGAGFVRGGAGTVYLKQGAARGTVTVSNGGGDGETTELGGVNDWDTNLVVRGRAVLGHARQAEGTELRIAGDVHVQSDGFIAMTGRGRPTSTGDGAGANSGGAAGGAGHGGAGGRSSFNAPGGGTYGDVLSPSTLGSGGGRDTDCCGFRTAGSGGGALRLTVDGVLTVDGELSVRGGNATPESGGGSGGSLLIQAGAVAGGGIISAAGGNGWTTLGGGGGGGRIAVYACAITMPLANIQAPGGTGFQAGGAGTVYFGSSSITFTQHPSVQSLRVGQTASFTVVATTTQNPPTLSYQWRKQNATGAYVNLSEGQGGGRYWGVSTPTLTITDLVCPDTGRYDCVVTDACGSAPSRAGGLAVKNPADIATEGSSDPNTGPDGFITGADFDTYVLVFFTEFRTTQGVLLGDLTDDTGYGEPDGFLTGTDFDRFILLFFQGCPL